MGREIERKFMVPGEAWREAVAAEGRGRAAEFRQFYLARRDDFSARVRIVDEARAFLTMKTGGGMARGEYEYEIPLADARELEAARVGEVIAKRRHRLEHGRHTIELDVFAGALSPLVIAEIELEAETDEFDLPDWFGRELTDDPAYGNAALALDGLPAEARP